MLYLADVKADKFFLPRHSSKVWGTAAVSTKKIGNFWAKPGSCVQTNACDSWRQSSCWISSFGLFLLSLFVCLSLLHFSSLQLQNLLWIWANSAGNFVSFQEEHKKAALTSSLPWFQWAKANCHWESILAVTGDSTEVPLKNKTERTPLYLSCCVCSTTPASLCHQKERIYELHLESPKSYQMHRWYLVYACIPENSKAFSTFIQCWSSHGSSHFCSFPHWVCHPARERNCNSLPHLLSHRWRRADMIGQELYMSYLYLRDHLIQMYVCLFFKPFPLFHPWKPSMQWYLILYPEFYLVEFPSVTHGQLEP